MPIFELDEGDARPVQPMQPVAGSFLAECATLVDRRLPAVLGEPVFAVRRAAPGEDAPELLGLDAAGRPLVVVVAQVLDEAALVGALRHAGRTGRLSAADLSRSFDGDPSRFSAEYARFRERVPYVDRASGERGVRVVVLTAEVTEGAADSLHFLRGSGRDVQVLQVGVVHGGDDRRLLEVAPLAADERGRRPVEPARLTGAVPVTAELGTDRGPEPERDAEPAPESAPEPDPALVALARGLGADQALVWVRARRGQRHEATLRVDGLVVLADGSVHADPGRAAAAAARTEHVPDGRHTWHLGDDGPSLADALAEAAQQRPHRRH
ncbi:hypothetical protein [Cellulomonas marina]|uniref:RAMA domain-containing protein n=1 Tax=Cellulomonas marina TaxID=988821 RepID=A0A1I0WMX2_9CELL|nr:hypothetical protein [Cellulomonas marina]GIG27764.1 hypothetical protein Cma02nite_03640 [Cellulomonas marina]SFA90125.1 hypothetical protein SAMN05421867_103113 [Cellulomonas marina]